MIKSYSRFLLVTFVGSCLIPTVTEVVSGYYYQLSVLIGRIGLSLALGLAGILLFRRLLPKLEPVLDGDAREQVRFIDTMPVRYVDLAIAGAAGVSLLLELSVIRWQSSVFPFFAFYTNFGLLACFAGLGLGYALASRDRIPLVLVLPLLAWQFALLIGLRATLQPWQVQLLGSVPIVEQQSMGLHTSSGFGKGFAIYFFLATVFLLTALTFIPLGQLCGRLMSRRPQLRAYGLNLLGSLGGVLAMFAASSYWTPPVVWYVGSFTVILLLSVWRPGTLVTGFAAAMVAVAILAWPVRNAWQRIYSPYQMLELGYSPKGTLLIRAAGNYYQRVHDFSVPRSVDDAEMRKTRDYYDLPYRVGGTPADVVVVGAGAGNDVAAALRAGASRIDAIEIDPAILRIGGANHPEHPYSNPKVHAVLADARSFLRTTNRTYDLIVYGLLDSHTLLSHASSVRLDSFVYTVQGFREARARLKPGGRIVLSFAIISPELGHKMEQMLREAFDGADPVVIAVGYDGAVTFMQSKEANLTVAPDQLRDTGFEITSRYSDHSIRVDPSTDDWPFFYMPRRVYPVSYLVMLGMVLLVSLSLSANFIRERPRVSEASFFLLGAGFMLVETKAITELGLMFGSTWRVIGIVIAGILLMAFLANAAVQRFAIKRPQVAFAFLLTTLAAGWYVIGTGGLPSTTAGRVASVALLTSPMFFSGIVFSTLLARRGAVSGVMAANLIGAMCGGLLEYNSMYFGFRFLYLLAMGFYATAFVVWMAASRRAVVSPVAERNDRSGRLTPPSLSQATS
jgi:spermidine synthase